VNHAFWITSRAAGVVALLASSGAMTAGLLMGGRFVRRSIDLRATHEALALATLIALGVHAFALLGDGFLSPSLADVTIPFAADFQRWWMAAGIVGGWMLVILGLSYYARARIGVQRWRSLHRFTALAWVLGLMHSLGQGTDAGTAWFLIAGAMVVIPAFMLLFARLNQEPAAA
jgi:methionine sulfoxide reductase heme-binding subunit